MQLTNAGQTDIAYSVGLKKDQSRFLTMEKQYSILFYIYILTLFIVVTKTSRLYFRIPGKALEMLALSGPGTAWLSGLE